MATKASGTLFLIIEKQHASWDLMVTASPALELHFWCQLRIASARPILGPHWQCSINQLEVVPRSRKIRLQPTALSTGSALWSALSPPLFVSP